MERVSFKVAKAIKGGGYPQGQEEYAYRSNGKMYIFESEFEHIPDYCCDAPTYLEVWLWLWREKKVEIEIFNDGVGLTSQIRSQGRPQFFNKDPEEAIIAAIEYLVEMI